MRHQRLKSVVVEGFTSIRSATLTLNDVNVLVGANGAGKSNFIRALSVLGRIVDSELGLFVGLSGGANALLTTGKAKSRLIDHLSAGLWCRTAALLSAHRIRDPSQANHMTLLCGDLSGRTVARCAKTGLSSRSA